MTAGTRRAVFAALLVGPVLVVVGVLGRIFAEGGLTAAEAGLLALYGILLAWIGSGFWFCVFGLFNKGTREPSSAPDLGPSFSAIVIPVYHEDADAVFARIRVMYRALERSGRLGSFEFFVLSDSQDPAHRRGESQAWFDACLDLQAFGRLFYRRRARNLGRKSGNIEEFCRRWGGRYDYMIVLDADSVMCGDTLVEMVRRMQADPGLGLIQARPVSVRGASLFARLQQFAGATYGELMTRGLAWFVGESGTYWGHNAIIRMRAFTACCALPALPGREPLGGQILSHDFVEAALLLRAGWRVRFDPDLGGSFEEGPPSLIDHAARDRRWCQGNLQHAYILFAKGLHPMSRLNFLAGIMSYLSGPLWLLFIGLAVAAIFAGGSAALPAAWSPAAWSPAAWSFGRPMLLGVLGFTGVLLFGPKLISLAYVLADRERRRAQGGALRLVAGVLLESLFGVLLAPIMMALHTRFVAAILAGWSSGWGPQRRDADGTYWRDALAAHGIDTLLGFGLAAASFVFLPEIFWWLLPVAAGLILSIPLSVFTSRAAWGRGARALGLFAIPAETAPPRELAELERLLADETEETTAVAPLPSLARRPLEIAGGGIVGGASRSIMTTHPRQQPAMSKQ
jgi:membrane glycosyltransferase